MHHQKLQLLSVVDNKLLKPIGKKVAGLLVRSITNVGHQSDTLELSPDPGVNTLGPPPVGLS